ncbi:MAG: NUDIX hydrolase [Bacteroidia bacterium]|nr:NUDIX hydrolase [Bacteroidia bacterium]MDW8157345.1 NUDIX hydrolase [Bacteroidia bacterium]
MQNPWQILQSQKIYDNPWIELTEFQVITPGGRPGIYGVVHFKHLAIGIVPIDNEENIWLVGQYRFPLNAYSWEIPEGGGKLDIDPLVSAKRELWEETGITAQKWKELFRMHLSNSVSDELAIIYLAQELDLGSPHPEDTEQLALRKVSLNQAYQMVLQGEITDSLSVAAIFRLQLMKWEKQL